MTKWAIIISAALAAISGHMPTGTFQAQQGAAAEPFKGEEWYDQIATVRVNREGGRAFFVPYQDAATALANEASAFTRDFGKSAYYHSLNGTWKFKVVNKPADRIDGFWQPAFDVAQWDDMPVPSNWQTMRSPDGTLKYDMPIYINVEYPWGNFGGEVSMKNPVKAPTKFNPVGHYRRDFSLPANWGGRRVFASFQGVESAFYLWVNGHKVGYAEDSYTQSEFDITKYLKPGQNTMAVQVYRWSLGSYLENQDFIRLSGIFRDVFLYSKAEVEIRDFFVKPALGNDFKNGDLSLEASIRNFGRAAGNYTVEATLKNMDGTNVWADGPIAVPVALRAGGRAPFAVDVAGSKAVQAPRLWFAETPELYQLLIQLKDPRGNVVETAVSRVGFRKIERADVPGDPAHQMLLYNGKRILLRGVNRHETSPDNGRALTKGEIIQDLLIMKRNNINAIRTSHYPNNPITYDFADELGIYICNEANVESHMGASQRDPNDCIPGNNPLWVNSVVDRTASMVERDKNHPSVIIWSLGNEATYTVRPPAPYTDYAFYSSSQYIRKRDPNRPIKYERDNRADIVDIRSVQYPNYRGARDTAISTAPGPRSYMADSDFRMPFLMNEYSHSMGNAGGGFSEYWKLFREVPQVQGGFIWEYVDHSVWLNVPKDAPNQGSGKFFGYGGDWGEAQHDGNFCTDGILHPDRTPKPFVNEIRHCQQEIWYTATEGGLKKGSINVSNEFLNKNLSAYSHHWRILKDGAAIDSGTMELNIAPMAKQDITIAAVGRIAPEPGAEYFLDIWAAAKADAPWAKAGHVIASEQFKLPISERKSGFAIDTSKLPAFASLADTQESVVAAGAGFSITFDKAAGEIASIKKDGKELIAAGPRINHWRHPGDNDVRRGAGQFNATFADTWKNSTKQGIQTQRGADGKSIAITVPSTLQNGASNKTVYTIYSNGEIIVENTLASDLENYLLRVGMKMEMPEGYQHLTYYGRGPGENYADRATASHLGIHKAKVGDMYTPYTRPQFFGNRTGVRWMAVTNASGDGLLIAAAGTIEACASNYDDADFVQIGAPVRNQGQDPNRVDPLNPQSAQNTLPVRHLYQVPMKKTAVLNIDMLQAPIGCHGGFNAERPPIEELIPAKGTYTYSYKIVPIAGATPATIAAASK